MSISFGEIFLYSHNPAKLYNFLSFLLDIEADAFEDEEISFSFKGIKFLILMSEKKKIDKTKYFSLNVNSQIELDDLVQNINFYNYKEDQKALDVHQDSDSISFNDPDGRVWEVKIFEQPIFANKSVVNKSSNVRLC